MIENGNCAVARKFNKDGDLDKTLGESTVRSWVSLCKKELERKRKMDETVPEITVLPQAKRGHLLVIGEKLDGAVKAYVRGIHEAGGVVTLSIVAAAATAMVRKDDAKLLAENGGPLSITTNWAKSLLYRMQFVKRRGSTNKKILVHDFEAIKTQFLIDVTAVVQMEDIPEDLILNWDHTGVHIVPGSSWTMDSKGQQRVEIAAMNDKRQMTVVVCGSLSGNLLPFQLIYQGKTAASVPKVEFPKEWHVTATENHWSNEEKTKEYIKLIILPYVEKKRKELGLPTTFPALVLFDAFKGQTTELIYELLESNAIYIVSIPANCTDKLQPMDLSVNKSIKEFLKNKFGEWYASMVFANCNNSLTPAPLDLQISIMKPLNAKWLLDAHSYLQRNPSIILNGFKAAGITDALKDSM